MLQYKCGVDRWFTYRKGVPRNRAPFLFSPRPQAHSSSTPLAEKYKMCSFVRLRCCALSHSAATVKGYARQKRTFCIVRAKSAKCAFFCAALLPELANKCEQQASTPQTEKCFFGALGCAFAALRAALRLVTITETKIPRAPHALFFLQNKYFV